MANGLNPINQVNPYPQAEFLDTNTKRPTRAWQQFFLNLLNFVSYSSATAGSATLPAKPVGFITILVNGQPKKLPYYDL
jgi:hypothetical protein